MESWLEPRATVSVHFGAGRFAHDGGGEIVAAVDSLAVHGGDHIAAVQAGPLGGALAGGVVHEAGDEHTALHGEAVGGGERGGDVLALDADEALAGGGDAAVLDDLRGDGGDAVGGNGIADAAGGARRSGDW